MTRETLSDDTEKVMWFSMGLLCCVCPLNCDKENFEDFNRIQSEVCLIQKYVFDEAKFYGPFTKNKFHGDRKFATVSYSF